MNDYVIGVDLARPGGDCTVIFAYKDTDNWWKIVVDSPLL